MINFFIICIEVCGTIAKRQRWVDAPNNDMNIDKVARDSG